MIFCPFCGDKLEVDEYSFFVCLRCGAEILPGEVTADPYEDWRDCWRDDVKGRPIKKGGGSRKSGRRFDKKKVKHLPAGRWRFE